MDLGLIIKTGLSFLGVIGLILLVAQGLKRWQLRGGLSFLPPTTGGMRLRDQLILDSQRRVVVVQDQTSEYLLLLGAHNDVLLTTRKREEKGSHG